jgi:hypothetical protein
VAASLLGDNLLLSIAVGVTGGVLLGFAVDKVMSLLGLAAPDMPDLADEIEHRQEAEQGQPGERKVEAADE